ncbi:MAG: hypothetical protein Q8K83_01130 [Methylotenera sp.]|nr:hypothetical protein [Methylotenera sp.]
MKPSQQILNNAHIHQAANVNGNQADVIKATFIIEEIMISYNTYLINVRKAA